MITATQKGFPVIQIYIYTFVCNIDDTYDNAYVFDKNLDFDVHSLNYCYSFQ